MDAFDAFKNELREALTHLHDPDYQPPETLCRVLGVPPGQGAGPVQQEILRAIEVLKPAGDVPRRSADWRHYDILRYRFVSRMTQEATAECLDISDRTLRRAQRVATHRLARLLWEHGLANGMASGLAGNQAAPSTTADADEPLPDWQAQVRQDLAPLQSSAAGIVSDVRDAIQAAVALESVLSSRHGIALQIGTVAPGLRSALHPSVLRQVLVMAIAQLLRWAAPGQVIIEAAEEERETIISLTGRASEDAPTLHADIVQEILAAQGGSIEVAREDDQVWISLRVPSSGEVTVLVVDDNPDSIHYYRRCTAGTKYVIVHAAQGAAAAECAAQARPDVIVLDIMLPDTDGWQLLAHLRNNPVTQHVPVVICSIVREEELAAALGAILYLPKPVKRQDFLQALDRALSSSPPAETKAPASNATAG